MTDGEGVTVCLFHLLGSGFEGGTKEPVLGRVLDSDVRSTGSARAGWLAESGVEAVN